MKIIDDTNLLKIYGIMCDCIGKKATSIDINIMEKISKAPYETFNGIDIFPSLTSKGGKYCYDIIKEDAFGNMSKPMGILVMLIFFSINGVEIRADDSTLKKIANDIHNNSISFTSFMDTLQ